MCHYEGPNPMTPPAKNSVEIRLELGWDDEQFEAELDAMDAVGAGVFGAPVGGVVKQYPSHFRRMIREDERIGREHEEMLAGRVLVYLVGIAEDLRSWPEIDSIWSTKEAADKRVAELIALGRWMPAVIRIPLDYRP
jgi:hypothetical protein